MTESKNTMRYALFFATTFILQFQLMGIGSHGLLKSHMYEARLRKELSDEILYKVVNFMSDLSSFSFYVSLSLLILAIIFVFGDHSYSRLQKIFLIGTNGFLIILKTMLTRMA